MSDLLQDKKELVVAAIAYDLVMAEESYLKRRDVDSFRSLYVDSGENFSMVRYAPMNSMAHYMNMITEKPIYRVRINEKLGIDIECYDLLENWYPELEKHYEVIGDLPKWVQEKLAVLMVLDPDIPNGEITGIGRRISQRVFWVYTDGRDSREESQKESESIA